jgi:IS30 family transposase
MARFSERMVTEVVQQLWEAMARGEFITGAAAQAGTYRKKGARWLAVEGGVGPRRGRNLMGRCLTFAEREEIGLARAGGESMRAIARRLGRSPSTISRELQRNAGAAGCYRATTAHALAYERASRPKPAKLATNLVLRRNVEQDLRRRYSPEQIVGRLRQEFPQNPEMWVSTETIYQSLYVQSRGALRRDLTKLLRTGRALRRPCRQAGQRKNRIPDMINITERPAEADDRAVPGHWESDLIIGKNNATATGTLVERTTGYTMLVHLPDGYKAEHVRDALAAKIQTIPDILRASLTWDPERVYVDHGLTGITRARAHRPRRQAQPRRLRSRPNRPCRTPAVQRAGDGRRIRRRSDQDENPRRHEDRPRQGTPARQTAKAQRPPRGPPRRVASCRHSHQR